MEISLQHQTLTMINRKAKWVLDFQNKSQLYLNSRLICFNIYVIFKTKALNSYIKLTTLIIKSFRIEFVKFIVPHFKIGNLFHLKKNNNNFLGSKYHAFSPYNVFIPNFLQQATDQV